MKGINSWNQSLALAREAELKAHLLDLEGRRLAQQWTAAFPTAMPIRLVRIAGESNTLLRWRCSTSTRAVVGGRFELIDELPLIQSLPESVQHRLLDFESSRIQLNFDYAMTLYQSKRLADYHRHVLALGDLRRAIQTIPSGAG
jgi:hypothetical protein